MLYIDISLFKLFKFSKFGLIVILRFFVIFVIFFKFCKLVNDWLLLIIKLLLMAVNWLRGLRLVILFGVVFVIVSVLGIMV